MSLPSRLRVFVAGSSAPGAAGSGICFTQTTTFMAGHCYRTVTNGARRVRRRPGPIAPGRTGSTVDGLVRLLLVVNSFASSVTARNTVVVHQVLSQEHDVQIVETSRRGHAT